MTSQQTTGRLAGRNALIFGGSRGIGLGIAIEFAKEGANIMLAATDAARLAMAQEDLAQYGTTVRTLVADISDQKACFSAVNDTITALDGLDILVNSAAVYIPRPFLDYETEDLERSYVVNVQGPFHAMQAALPHMVEKNYGRVINVASTAGKWASKNQCVYNMSKHALVGLTRCVALEYASHGITVNALCPGLVQTDMAEQLLDKQAAINRTTPALLRAELLKKVASGRLLDVAECGHFAVYLASSDAKGMTGQSVLLDGGMLFV
jgi:NAD(P)-dependent dehydrogenase (short-subunit alcohol dehydrogenase family)